MKINKFLPIVVFTGVLVFINVLFVLGFVIINPLLNNPGAAEPVTLLYFKNIIPLFILITLVFYISFMLIYLYPVIKNKNEAAKKRILNAPLTVSFIGMSGWIAFLIERIAVVIINKIDADQYFVRANIIILVFGILCFTAVYFLLLFINRHYFIPAILSDKNIPELADDVSVKDINKSSQDSDKKLIVENVSCKSADNENVEYEEKEEYNTEQAAILFTDIREFKYIYKNLEAEKIMKILNIYFEKMGSCILKKGGEVNRQFGDAVLAVFNVPNKLENYPSAAIKAAVDMRRELRLLNTDLEKQGLPVLNNGIGIHSGEVITGNINIGSKREYTVLGHSVNIASIIEILTKNLKTPVIVSGSVIEDAGKITDICYREIDIVQVPEKKEPITLFEIFNHEPEEVIEKKYKIDSHLKTGFSYYRNGNFREAKEIFLQCIETCPMDVIPKIYILRCNKYIENPPGPGWNGITDIIK